MPQQQTPPTATYAVIRTTDSTSIEDGKPIIRQNKVECLVALPLEASTIHVNFHLDPRQKGLL